MLNQQEKLKISSKASFIKFIDAFAIVSESLILNIEKNAITAISNSADNTVIAYGEYKHSDDFIASLNIPSCKKLKDVIDCIEEEEPTLLLNSNNIEYKSRYQKFKYHLFEDGFLTKPALSVDKIKNFKYNVSFTFSHVLLKKIIKGCTFTTNTDKLYFYTEGGVLFAELTDRVKHNTDSFSVAVGEVDFKLDPIPINVNNFRQLCILNSIFEIGINTDFGAFIIKTSNQDTDLIYFINSYVQ
jgi:hypothetical protein